MTRPISVVLIALSLLAVGGDRASAHSGHEHKMMGTVTMVASDHVMFEDRKGDEATVYITASTKVLRNKRPVSVEDIQKGMRVVVTAVTEKVQDEDRMRAVTIELGPAPKKK